jgi:hypothetical protein
MRKETNCRTFLMAQASASPRVVAKTGALQQLFGMGQRIGIAHFEADRLAGIEPVDIDQRVVAIIGAEIG